MIVAAMNPLDQPQGFVAIGEALGKLPKFGKAPGDKGQGNRDREATIRIDAETLIAQGALQRCYFAPEVGRGSLVVAQVVVNLAPASGLP